MCLSTFTPTRPCYIILPKQFHSLGIEHSNIWANGGPFSFTPSHWGRLSPLTPICSHHFLVACASLCGVEPVQCLLVLSPFSSHLLLRLSKWSFNVTRHNPLALKIIPPPPTPALLLPVTPDLRCGGIVDASIATGLRSSAFGMLVDSCSGLCVLQRELSLVRADYWNQHLSTWT